MKSIMIAILVFSATAFYGGASQAAQNKGAAKAESSEPDPQEEPRQGGGDPIDPQQETYEGNDRSGGSFDGGGYSDDGRAGSELFLKLGANTHNVSTKITREDRGATVVVTKTDIEALSAFEICTKVAVTVIDKETQKVISSNSNEFCNVISY